MTKSQDPRSKYTSKKFLKSFVSGLTNSLDSFFISINLK